MARAYSAPPPRIGDLLTPRCVALQWARTVVSTVHAAMMALLACYFVFYVQDLNMWDEFSTRHRIWEQVVCCSLGYFMYDLIQISVFKPTPSDYYESLFHHLINIYVHFIPVCIYHGYVQLSMVGCKLSNSQCVPIEVTEQALYLLGPFPGSC